MPSRFTSGRRSSVASTARMPFCFCLLVRRRSPTLRLFRRPDKSWRTPSIASSRRAPRPAIGFISTSPGMAFRRPTSVPAAGRCWCRPTSSISSKTSFCFFSSTSSSIHCEIARPASSSFSSMPAAISRWTIGTSPWPRPAPGGRRAGPVLAANMRFSRLRPGRLPRAITGSEFSPVPCAAPSTAKARCSNGTTIRPTSSAGTAWPNS